MWSWRCTYATPSSSSRSIPYLFSWVQFGRLQDPRFSTNPAIAPLAALLDRPRIAPVSLLNFAVDLAADGQHPGPRSNHAFANSLFEFFRSSGDPARR